MKLIIWILNFAAAASIIFGWGWDYGNNSSIPAENINYQRKYHRSNAHIPIFRLQKEFFDILRERNKNGVTVFLSSHILSEIQHNCTRAAIVREGKLIACDSVEALSKTNAKRVTINGAFDTEKLGDVRDIQRTAENVSFLYGGDINELIRCLCEQRINDLSVSEPDLEEIFMHYYTDGEVTE